MTTSSIRIKYYSVTVFFLGWEDEKANTAKYVPQGFFCEWVQYTSTSSACCDHEDD